MIKRTVLKSKRLNYIQKIMNSGNKTKTTWGILREKTNKIQKKTK